MNFLSFPNFNFITGFIPFLIYLLVFLINLCSFSKDVKSRLYSRTLYTKKQKYFTLIYKLLALVNIIIFFITPISFYTNTFLIGSILFLLGLLGLTLALQTYSKSPINNPIINWLYKFSRNPQMFSLWLIFLGISLMINSFLSIFLLFIAILLSHQSVLAEEEYCKSKYGIEYEKYLKAVPRYLFF